MHRVGRKYNTPIIKNIAHLCVVTVIKLLQTDVKEAQLLKLNEMSFRSQNAACSVYFLFTLKTKPHQSLCLDDNRTSIQLAAFITA